MSLSQPIHNIGSHPSTMSDPISIPEEKKSNPDPVQDDANNSKDIESSSNPVNENVVVFPDGGSAAWLQVVGGFILMFDTWGLVNTFGVFQAHYSSLSPPLASSSAISWIGSVQSFLLLCAGAVCGRFFDQGYGRTMTYFGTFLLILGLLASSFSNEAGRPVYWHLLLSQGICCGLGMGCMMVPALGIVSTYFNRRRAFAIGIVTTGSSIGGIVYPILIRLLLEKLGFHWAMRILAFVVLGTLAIGCIMLKQREDIVLIRKREAAEKKGKGGPSTLQIILKDWAYLSFVLGMFWTCLGLYSPFFYIEEYTVLGGLDLKGLDSFYLVSIMNAGGAMGRIVPGIIADAIGPINTQAMSVFLAAITALSWISVSSLPSLILFAIFYGIFSGSSISLPPASVASLTTDISTLGTRMGFMFSCSGLAVLAGPPIAGALQTNLGGEKGRDVAKVFMGLVLVIGSLGMMGGRVLKVGWGFNKKS